jgi:dolichyl-phosphate beta-glucosyltransferase
MPTLSIILPAYNEADLIGQSLIKLNNYLSKEMSSDTVEVLVIVNSPASDGTLAKTEEAVSSFKTNKNHKFIIYDAKKRLGKGGAVKLGIQMAKGEYKLFMDTDLATPLHNIKEILNLAKKENSDLLIGVRNLSSMHKTLLRRISSQASNLAVQTLILPGFKDTQCGFKLFTAKSADLVFSKLTSTTWSFDMEAILIARENKLKIKQFPVNDWSDPKEDGLTGDNQIKVMVSEFKELLRFWWGRIIRQYI